MSNENKLSFGTIKQLVASQNTELYKQFARENLVKSIVEQVYTQIRQRRKIELFRDYLNQNHYNTELQKLYLQKYQSYILDHRILNTTNYQD